MNCKNCQQAHGTTAKFCSNCGAEIVTERITLGHLWRDFAEKAFGWDNRYLITTKLLLLHPHILFKEYLGGTRKKYSNPFTYFAIAAALGLLVFSQFTDNYMRMAESMNTAQFESMEPFYKKLALEEHEAALKDSTLSEPAEFDFAKYKAEIIKNSNDMQKDVLKNYNFWAFLLLPIYAFIAFIVYRKPYSYGEHLVINAYIQGLLLLVAVVFFLISLVVSPMVYFALLPMSILYYLYAYAKLYKLSFGASIPKLFKFFMVLLGVSVVMFLLGVFVGFLRSF